MASAASPIFRLQDVTREKNACDVEIVTLWRGVFRVRVVVRQGSCSMLEICQSTFLTPVYWHAAFRYPTRHDALHKPRKKRKVCQTQNTRRGPKHSSSFSKVLAQNTPYSSPCECTPGTKERGYSFDSQKKRCRVGHSENPCSHAKKVMGGVQIRLRFTLG